MARPKKAVLDRSLLAAALEGLLLQKSRIEEQIRQVKAMMAEAPPPAEPSVLASKKRSLSAASRRTIALAQKKRWATYRKQKEKAAEN